MMSHGCKVPTVLVVVFLRPEAEIWGGGDVITKQGN